MGFQFRHIDPGVLPDPGLGGIGYCALVLLYAYPAWAAVPGPAREQPQAEIHGLQRTSAAHSGLYHFGYVLGVGRGFARSEEHTSELQSLMRISYAVFCLKKKKTKIHHHI